METRFKGKSEARKLYRSCVYISLCGGYCRKLVLTFNDVPDAPLGPGLEGCPCNKVQSEMPSLSPSLSPSWGDVSLQPLQCARNDLWAHDEERDVPVLAVISLGGDVGFRGLVAGSQAA